MSDDVFLPTFTVNRSNGDSDNPLSMDAVVSQYRPCRQGFMPPNKEKGTRQGTVLGNRFPSSVVINGFECDCASGCKSGHLWDKVTKWKRYSYEPHNQFEIRQNACTATFIASDNNVDEENCLHNFCRSSCRSQMSPKKQRPMSIPNFNVDAVGHRCHKGVFNCKDNNCIMPQDERHLQQSTCYKANYCVIQSDYEAVPSPHSHHKQHSYITGGWTRKFPNYSDGDSPTVFQRTGVDNSLEYSSKLFSADIVFDDRVNGFNFKTHGNPVINSNMELLDRIRNYSNIKFPNHMITHFSNMAHSDIHKTEIATDRDISTCNNNKSIRYDQSNQGRSLNAYFTRANSDPGRRTKRHFQRLNPRYVDRLSENTSLTLKSSDQKSNLKSAVTSSFGRQGQGNARRTSECLTLEPSDMIVIDFPDATAMKSASNARAVVSASNVEHLLNDSHTQDKAIRRMNSDSIMEQPLGGLEHQGSKRFSRASDSSSAYSGSDVMHTSLDDLDVPDMDLSGLAKSLVGSDDEDEYAESTETCSIRDAERDCLEKEPSERTEEDIQILLNFTQHLKAFSNMTEHTRRLLCEVMVFAIVPKEGTIVMKDGEELDSWSVILNGEVEITRPSGVKERLQMGDSFGIRPTMEKLYHQGVMRTVVNDCQFVCIAQSSYYKILHQGEENIKQHEEKGRIVMVTEHRELDGGEKKGHIVIRGTSERLMQHLIESHSAIDPNYVDDFLLTYRAFLSSPLDLVKNLLEWFQNDDLKTNVTRVVLLWVNNHFNDFETNPDMCDFLEHFECLLEREKKMMGQLSLLNMACAAKARQRVVTLTRATREEILNFSILGGLERNHGIFVTKVHPGSKAAEAGLKRGDQILEVNGHKFQQIYYNKALEILRGTTHLSITVKSNLQEFKEMLRSSDKVTSRKLKRDDGNALNPKQRLSVPDLDSSVPIFHLDLVDEKKSEKRSGIFGTNSRLRKALTRINIMPKNLNGKDTGSVNHSDESLYSKPSRKSSTSSSSSNPGSTISGHLSASNPDITLTGLAVDDRSDVPEHALKIFRSDQSFKYLLIHKETTAKEVVMLALQEFSVTDSSSNYSLCEVTVEMEKFIKSKRLPDSLNNLPERLNLNGRYYLKNNLSTEQLIPDDLIGLLLIESQINLLQLNTHEVAWQLTLNDYRVFREIEPTEYVDDLYGIESRYGCAQIHKFAELVNKEMFWVVTEICSETSLVKRTKLLKHFIEIAKHCKDSKNFNSMFAILSGLGHGSVSRLKLTWERLPGKYLKLFEDLQSLMDPSRNMAKYRNLINSEHVQPPYIPFYPIFKKDLTFIHLGNDSLIDGLINFEKLRMIAKEVRHICNICSTKYDSNNMFLSTNNSFQSALVSGMATLKRTKNRRGSALPNAKKMYEEAQMVRRVRSYLSIMPSITDEDKITALSNQCEIQVKKRDQSPSINNSPNMEEKRVMMLMGPKFGAESPGAVRKLMALSDRVKPHDPRIPVGNIVSPVINRKISDPISPRTGLSRPVPLNLTPESSCLGPGPRKKPVRMGSLSSSESQSPTGSIRGMKNQHSAENDSGHGSIASNVSPKQHRRLTAPAGPVYCPVSGQISNIRPPLPSYSTVLSHSSMSAPVVSNYSSHPGFPVGRRPPLPDYEAATTMAQLARQQHQRQQHHHQRSYSHDNSVYTGSSHGSGSVTSADSDYDLPTMEGADEEQVSAV